MVNAYCRGKSVPGRLATRQLEISVSLFVADSVVGVVGLVDLRREASVMAVVVVVVVESINRR